MSKNKRTLVDKLNTFVKGKDLRVTEGEPFAQIYDGDFVSYLPKEKYIKPQQPDKKRIYDIRLYGASPQYNSTSFINRAIETCHLNGGGIVLVTGGSYTVNTIILKSNVTLFIDSTSQLVASHEVEKYEKQAVIYAKNCNNIEITGGGKICGEGNCFGLKPIEEPCFEPDDIIDVIKMRRDYRAKIRFAHMSKYGSICNISDCIGVNIHNIIMENSAYWTLHIHMCNDVSIYDFIINNNRHVANADGIDLNCSSNVNINNCFISTSDDGICIKNAAYTGCVGEMSNVNITNCEVISCANCFKIGTETTNDIHSVNVSNCKFFMTDIYPGCVSGISIETCDGAKVYDINIRNIEMDRASCPVFIRLSNRNRAAKVDVNSARATEMKVDKKYKPKTFSKNYFNFKSELYNVNIENVIATDIEEPIIICGFRDKYGTKRVKNITLKNFDMKYRDAKEIIDKRLYIPEYAHEYPESNRFRNLPSYRFFIRHAEGLHLDNIKCEPTKSTWKKEDYIKDNK